MPSMRSFAASSCCDRELVLRAEIVGERAEVLELAPALELHDPALLPLLEGDVQRQPAVEVAERVLRRHDRAPGESMPPSTASYDASFVCMSPTAPTPTLHVRKITSRSAASACAVRVSSIVRTESTEVTASAEYTSQPFDVVDAARLADPDEDAVQRRLRRIQLVEAGRVDVPELGVRGVERAEPVGEVLLERRGERQHVGAQEHLHAELVGAVPERPERVAQRERLRAMIVALGVYGAVRRIVEGDVLDQTGERDRVVAVGERVPDEHVEVVERVGERRPDRCRAARAAARPRRPWTRASSRRPPPMRPGRA